jgi:SRSO17 transposase
MERRFEVRMNELLRECEVPPEVFEGVLERLRRFVEPFAVSLCRLEQGIHARTYVAGLLSNLDRKNVESIAYRHDQDRRALQNFIGCSSWDHEPLLEELTQQVATALGETDGVIVFDPSAFPKKGQHSVAVDRQWCGRLGKVDNCQLGVFLAYVTRKEQALLDMRLYLPKCWATDRRRRKECGVPKHLRYRTRHQLALEMLDRRGSQLPHSWIAGDDEMGRSTRFRRALRERGERYLLAVPSNTIIRDLDAPAPPWRGSGLKPKPPFEQVRRWAAALSPQAWTRIDVRDGHKGPLVVESVKTRVEAKTDTRCIGPEEVLVVTRTIDESGDTKIDYYLSSALPETPLEEFVRVAKAEHRVEECLQRAKSEAGLADYEVRTWTGWHHHQALSLIATWFLVQESQRGKKTYAGDDCLASSHGTGHVFALRLRLPSSQLHRPRNTTPFATYCTSQVVSLEET